MKKIIFLFSFLIFSITFLFADDISLSADKSYAVLSHNNKKIHLEDNAIVKTGSFVIKSNIMEIQGDDSNFITCQGNVSIKDEDAKLSIYTQNLSYFRDKDLISIDNWVFIEDLKNELVTSAGSLLYKNKEESMSLSMDVLIYKNSDDGLMVCSAEIVDFDRKNEKLVLKGRAKVTLNNNTYEAAIIKVDLKTNEITLDGNVKAKVKSDE